MDCAVEAVTDSVSKSSDVQATGRNSNSGKHHFVQSLERMDFLSHC